nr:MAG TPA: hypothetical protein [Caudoviricetes sp.]
MFANSKTLSIFADIMVLELDKILILSGFCCFYKLQ